MNHCHECNVIEKEEIINTRKELWDNLFLVVDFSRMKDQYPNIWNKEYKMLPLPNTYSEIRKKFSEYCGKINEIVGNLVEGYRPYFNSEVMPLLNKPEGDKTLLFRCKRLLDNKVIGETNSLFLDLVIWEVEYRQVEKFKELVRVLNTQPMFLTDREDELFANDCEKMIEGRINYLLAQRFYLKWSQLIAKSGQQKEEWAEIGDYLKKWQAGKATKSEWHKNFKGMEKFRDETFMLGSESISDGKPFLQLGYVKEDTEEGLRIVLQNKKGFNLNNPYLWVVHLHQKIVRPYVVRGYRMVNPRSLYVEISLSEDWVWKDYPVIMSGKGSIDSSNHMIYHKRNLGDN